MASSTLEMTEYKVADLGLADIFIQQLGPQGALDRLLIGRGGGSVDDALFGEVVGLDSHSRDFIKACV